ncbi:Caseinolytic peptidase B protein-like protein [Psilocybe cubensis]|uniref:Caseinolytic peptidase B protein-like protein n=1 Tax=Psilocybe cubensis TaxID=181762 RepID=A0ACB8GVE6_PSICU|nr:Caseinolytic peptidase B protein-like protein [Psilocybe cubensis]KAH9478955.1 Caseinolytic peptidase B protein-like protein [Psilocybe cubensis]
MTTETIIVHPHNPPATSASRTLCRLLVRNEIVRVQKLLETFPELINIRHPLGWAPIHTAVLCCDTTLLKFILNLPRVDIAVQDESSFSSSSSAAYQLCRTQELCPTIGGTESTQGATALHFACMRGDKDVLNLVLQRGGASAYNALDHSQRTPLDYFDLDTVDLEALLAYQSAEKQWKKDWRTLVAKDVFVFCSSIRLGDYDYCKELIECYPDLAIKMYSEIKDSVSSKLRSIFKPSSVEVSTIVPDYPLHGPGSSALHYACLEARMDIAELLLRNGATWTEKDDYNITPQMYANLHGEIIAQKFKSLCDEEDRLRKQRIEEESRKMELGENIRESEVLQGQKAEMDGPATQEEDALQWAVDFAEQLALEVGKRKADEVDVDKMEKGEPRISKAEKRQMKALEKQKEKDKKMEKREQKKKEDERRRRNVLTSSQLAVEIERIIGADIIGQKGPISSVASAIRLRENGWVDRDRPLVMLFLGSSGIGKTEVAKRVAMYLHGIKAEKEDEKVDDEPRSPISEDDDGDEQQKASLTDIEKSGTFVRIDMSEYQHDYTVSNLTGSPKGYVGYDEGGVLTGKLKANPRAIVLLDEIEKAHPNVLTVFLQLFDDGRITDPKLGTIFCPNAVFIMTSNLGSEEIRLAAPKLNSLIANTIDVNKHEKYHKGVTQFTKELYPLLKRSLKRDEFLGRINQTVVFLPFTDVELGHIAKVELKKWQKRALDQHDIHVTWSPSVIERLIQGYDVNYGARGTYREGYLSFFYLQHIVNEEPISSHVRMIVNAAGDMELETVAKADVPSA